LFSLLADLGISAMTTRELAREGADRPSVLSIALSSRVALSLLLIPVILGTGQILYPHKGSLFHLALAVMSFDVLFQAIQLTASTAFAVRVRGDLIAIIWMSNRALYLAGVIVTTVLHGSYLWYICSYVGADFIMAMVAVVAARRSIALRWTANLRQWWRSIALAFPLGIIQLVGNIYSWIDSILLSLLRTSTELGFYSVAFNVINVLGSIPSFLMQALIPSLVNADLPEISRLANRAVYVLFCIGAPLAVGGIVLRVDIISVLAGPRFLPAATALAILAGTIPVTFLQTALGYTSVSIDRYRPLLVVSVATLVLNIAINLILIPKFGASGAAGALLASEIVSLVATYVVFRHLSGVRVRWMGLWRPIVAAAAVLVLLPLRGSLWSHLVPVMAVVVGGAVVTGIYLLVLAVVGGVPDEFVGLGRRRRRPRRGRRTFVRRRAYPHSRKRRRRETQ
jgi:O-antigen/teichoic acid export membrane protein